MVVVLVVYFISILSPLKHMIFQMFLKYGHFIPICGQNDNNKFNL